MSAFRPLIGAVLASAALLLPGAQAWAQASNTVRIELGGAPVSRRLSLPRGKSAVVDLPVDARDVLVSNPKVADAVLRTPRRIFVLGVGPGETDAVFFDAAGRQILSLDIRVDQPVSAIEDTIRTIAPDASVKVEAVNDSLVLTGAVADAAESDRIQRVAAAFVDKPEKVINTLSIRSPEQVMIKVRVMEMQRNLVKQFGVSTSALLQGGTNGQVLLSNAPQFAVNNNLMGGLTAGYSYAEGLNKATGTLEAFERAGLVRSLAEPNLTAVSGESAKFLAGGEFPVPGGVDQNGNVLVDFKSYGVGLGFTPVVLSGGRISMRISTEVSQLSTDGELKFNGNLTIPGLTVRRADTTVEMPSGGALMIAGLLKEQTEQDIDSLPGLTNLPVLGSLFRSRDYLSGETELVIIVQPYLVKPGAPNQFQTPADGLVMASDMDTVLLGRLNKAYNGDKASPPPAWQGPVGYVIE